MVHQFEDEAAFPSSSRGPLPATKPPPSSSYYHPHPSMPRPRSRSVSPPGFSLLTRTAPGGQNAAMSVGSATDCPPPLNALHHMSQQRSMAPSSLDLAHLQQHHEAAILTLANMSDMVPAVPAAPARGGSAPVGRGGAAQGGPPPSMSTGGHHHQSKRPTIGVTTTTSAPVASTPAFTNVHALGSGARKDHLLEKAQQKQYQEEDEDDEVTFVSVTRPATNINTTTNTKRINRPRPTTTIATTTTTTHNSNNNNNSQTTTTNPHIINISNKNRRTLLVRPGAASPAVDVKPGQFGQQVGLLPGLHPPELTPYLTPEEGGPPKAPRKPRTNLAHLSEDEKTRRHREQVRTQGQAKRDMENKLKEGLEKECEKMRVYEFMMELSPSLMFTLSADVNCCILYANKVLTEMLGFTVGGILGQSFMDLIHPQDKARLLPLLGTCIMTTERPEQQVPCRMLCAAGFHPEHYKRVTLSMNLGTQGVVCSVWEADN